MIEVRDITYAYPRGGFELQVPRLDVAERRRTALIGPSGCGKSTLVSLIAGLLVPQRGTVRVANRLISGESDAARRDFRLRQLGFVFQDFALLDYLSVLDNMLLPFSLSARLRRSREAARRAAELAGHLGLQGRLDARPTELSYGERQRVAIGRALIAEPKLIIADEPTGNLDPDTAERVLAVLLAGAAREDATLLMVTHQHSLLEHFDEVVDLQALLSAAPVTSSD
jgi:putative ABC transport system ATP-binding protein